ncbi:MAG: glycoside hydrolase, partial [Candidatus Aminicenantes bacterium]|nr:glycoside hydrolase [Candidatus Aminicenantes bacterium]
MNGRVFMGPEPGLAAAIEWENGLVLTREPPAGQERPRSPEDVGRPRPEAGPERGERPEFFDLAGRWLGSNRIEVEVGQEGPEFFWREIKTEKTSHGRVEGERLWMAAAGDERRQVEGQILELDGPRAIKIRWQDGSVFTRGEASPAQEMMQAEKIVPALPEMQVLQAHLLKAKVYNVWVKMGGPLGGLGYDVRFSANTQAGKKIVYITDNYSGVNMSQDNGATWSASNNGITARAGTSKDAIPVFSLTVDPNNPKIVWCGLKDVSGAFKSTDGGKTWADFSAEKGSDFVYRGFTILTGKSNVVFAAGEDPMNIQGKSFDKTRGRVYKTEDGGKTWRKLWEGENLTRYVIVHPQNHDIIYVSTGIFDREANNSDCKNSILNTANLTGSYS